MTRHWSLKVLKFYSTGNIAVYTIGSALQMAAASDHSVVTDLLPTHYISVHQSAIRAIAWIRAPPSWPSGKSRYDQDPTVIASAGYDGVECLTDLREGRGAIMNRTRGIQFRYFESVSSETCLFVSKTSSMLSRTPLSLVGQSRWIVRTPSRHTLPLPVCWVEDIYYLNRRVRSGCAFSWSSRGPSKDLFRVFTLLTIILNWLWPLPMVLVQRRIF